MVPRLSDTGVFVLALPTDNRASNSPICATDQRTNSAMRATRHDMLHCTLADFPHCERHVGIGWGRFLTSTALIPWRST